MLDFKENPFVTMRIRNHSGSLDSHFEYYTHGVYYLHRSKQVRANRK